MYRKWWLLKAESGEVVRGWPVNIARQLSTAPIITRLYPLDLTLLVSTVSLLVVVVSLLVIKCSKVNRTFV